MPSLPLTCHVTILRPVTRAGVSSSFCITLLGYVHGYSSHSFDVYGGTVLETKCIVQTGKFGEAAKEKVY